MKATASNFFSVLVAMSLNFFWCPDLQGCESKFQIYGIISSDSANIYDVLEVPAHKDINFVYRGQRDVHAIC